MENNISTTPWLIAELARIKSKTLEYQALVSKLEIELKSSELMQRISKWKELLKELNCEEISMKNKWIEILQKAWIDKFESNWVQVKLKQSIWRLVVEDEEKIPEEYKKEKITIQVDKKAIKDDIKEWLIIDGVTIEQTLSLDIKYK